MHDPLALAVALDPSLAKLETTRVEVETEGRWTAGMTVADLRGIRTQPWAGEWQPEDNARVALGVDGDAFMDRFLGRLGGLVATRAENG
jgi:inosine-uridine nucleoside N-ribohydrolase